jgi:hypothetical protein
MQNYLESCESEVETEILDKSFRTWLQTYRRVTELTQN